MYDQLAKALAGAQKNRAQQNPWIQGGQALTGMQLPLSGGNPWESVAAGLAKGLGGGLMSQYGHNQVGQQNALENTALNSALTAENPLQAVSSDPRLKSIANQGLLAQLESDYQANQRQKELTQEYGFKKDFETHKGGVQRDNTRYQINQKYGADKALVNLKNQLEQQNKGPGGNQFAGIIDKEAAKQIGKDITESNKKYSSLIQLSRRALPAVEQANMGLMADWGLSDIKQRALGNGDVVAARKVIESLGPEYAAQARVVGSGAQSDREFASFIGTGPVLSDTPEAARAKVQALAAKGRIGIEQNKFVQSYIAQTGDVSGASAKWENYLNERETAKGPIFNFKDGKYQVSQDLPSAQEALIWGTPTPQAGSRQAPDPTSGSVPIKLPEFQKMSLDDLRKARQGLMR